MKKSFVILAAGAVLSAAAAPAFAEADVVYGTMEIPYAAFYAAEGVNGEVDAVSSATDSKWKNENLVAGTYYAEHTEDNGGDIPGVVYPVAISSADLAALGENTYGFQELADAPAAYKNVTLEDGNAVFSAVQGDTTEVQAEAEFTTVSRYGDYQINVNAINNADGTSDIGRIAGVLVSTGDGSNYALRHLENIWRDSLAWSCGITTVEAHGNVLNYAQYADMMGKTISNITYITDTGYHTLAVDFYVPLKFTGGVTVGEAAAADQTTALTYENIPEDFDPVYSVEGLECAVADGALTWDAAFAGAYTLEVKDNSGVYAPLYSDFVLTTEELPVTYDEASTAIVAAEGFEDAAVSAFLRNISVVTVNGTEYKASGKGAVVIIDEEGYVDPEAVITKGRGPDAETEPVFPESGSYEISAAATGYAAPVNFTFVVNK
ncbi:MAG: hypothetical protein IIY55_07570 [Blautia sp.]|nr:hypothetical protein [Blautia sp.]